MLAMLTKRGPRRPPRAHTRYDPRMLLHEMVAFGAVVNFTDWWPEHVTHKVKLRANK